jgi:hypothetical protein
MAASSEEGRRLPGRPIRWTACRSPRWRRSTGLVGHRRRHRRHGRRHHRRDPRHGRASGRQGLRHHRHGGPGAEGRRGLQPYPHRRDARKTSTPSASRPARPISCSAAISSCRATRRCCRPCARARRCSSPTRRRSCPGDFARSADFSLPTERIKKAIREAAGEGTGAFLRRHRARFRAVRQFARRQHVHARLRLSSMAGCRSRPRRSKRRSSSTARPSKMNLAAFRWGGAPPTTRRRSRARRAPGGGAGGRPRDRRWTRSSPARAEFLAAYQNAAYAGATATASRRSAGSGGARTPGSTAVTEAAARNLFKLMAIKDEYEVARLYTDGAFQKQLVGGVRELRTKLEFHLAPPILGRTGTDGKPRKSRFGSVDDDRLPAARP